MPHDTGEHGVWTPIYGEGDSFATAYEKLWPRLDALDGMMSYDEGETLFRLAAAGPGDGHVVEVGTFRARSAITMASAMLWAHRHGVIWTFDPHEFGPRFGHGETWPDAQANIRAWGFEHGGAVVPTEVQVWPRKVSSAEGAAMWAEKRPGWIRLLYVDGDHKYESVKRDWEAWRPFLHRDAVVAFHDYDHGNPKFDTAKLVNEIGDLFAKRWVIEKLWVGFGLEAESDG